MGAIIPNAGKLLREPRFVGDPSFLCDSSCEKLAIPAKVENLQRLRTVKLA